jgi:hypothetical protein
MNQGERHLVDWQHGMSGSFFTKLFECMASADPWNLDRMRLAFPEEADAMYRYKNEEGYWEALEAETLLRR